MPKSVKSVPNDVRLYPEDPYVYDAGGDISKEWHVNFYWWNGKKQKFERGRKKSFKGISSPNLVKNKAERYRQFAEMRDAIKLLLKNGWAPNNPIDFVPMEPAREEKEDPEEQFGVKTIREAIEKSLTIKESELSEFGFKGPKAHGNDFLEWLKKKKLDQKPPDKIRRAMITEYLRLVKATKGKNGGEASNKTRNNYLGSLGALFTKMVEEEWIEKNPAAGISKLSEETERNISFTPGEMLLMAGRMDKKQPYLKLFIQFIGYTYLRPSEILRLQVGDISLETGIIYSRAKKGKGGVSHRIPIIGRLRPTLELMLWENPPKHFYIFTKEKKPGSENIKRTSYFSNRFNRIKDWMNKEHNAGFGPDHTLYATRHTFIQDLYRHLRQTMTVAEAEYQLMPITRHKTLEALRKYIRDYSMEIPEDWSSMYSFDF